MTASVQFGEQLKSRKHDIPIPRVGQAGTGSTSNLKNFGAYGIGQSRPAFPIYEGLEQATAIEAAMLASYFMLITANWDTSVLRRSAEDCALDQAADVGYALFSLLTCRRHTGM